MPPGLKLPLPASPYIVKFPKGPSQRVKRQQREAEKPGGQHGKPPGDLFPKFLPGHDSISLTRCCTAS